MPVTIRATIQPGTPQEVTFERTYDGVPGTALLAAFRGFARATGMRDPDAATNQELVDHAFNRLFRIMWHDGRRAEQRHQAAQLPDTVPELPEDAP